MPAARIRVIKGAETISDISDRDRGVLLLHGFFGTPSEMRFLAKALSDSGFSVLAPRYPGHGTAIEEMTRSSVESWYECAREACIELSSRCREVHLAGLSMGALFAVLLAEEFAVPKIALMSMPSAVTGRGLYLTPVIGRFRKILYTSKKVRASLNKGVNNPVERARHISYTEGVPLLQVWQLHKMIQRAMKALPRVGSAALVIQSKGDETVPPDSLERIMRRLGSAHKESLLLERSGHALTVDYEKDIVADRVTRFFLS